MYACDWAAFLLCTAGVVPNETARPMYVPRMPPLVTNHSASQQQAVGQLQSVEQGAAPSAPGESVMANEEESAAVQECVSIVSACTTPTTSSSACSRVQSDSPPMAQEEPNRQGLCVVCWDSKPSWVCVPCGHLAMCKACSQAVKEKTNTCPVCRQLIRSINQVFLV